MKIETRSKKELGMNHMTSQTQQEAKTYTRSTDELGRGYGTGRGKQNCVAKVWAKYSKSPTNITVNGMSIQDYFCRESIAASIANVINTAFAGSGEANVEVTVNTYGGGKSGQARATKLGLARALVVLNNSLHGVLRNSGYLTRDSRISERMKPGQPGARKQYPYNRR